MIDVAGSGEPEPRGHRYVRLTPGVEEVQFQIKLGRARRFIAEGYRVRLELLVRRPTSARVERVRALARRFRAVLRSEGYGVE